MRDLEKLLKGLQELAESLSDDSDKAEDGEMHVGQVEKITEDMLRYLNKKLGDKNICKKNLFSTLIIMTEKIADQFEIEGLKRVEMHQEFVHMHLRRAMYLTHSILEDGDDD